MSISNLFTENYANLFSNTLYLIGDIKSTSTSSGTLVVEGGISASDNLFIGGDCHVSGTVYVPSIIYEDKTHITSTINSSSTSTGALTVTGGVGIAQDVYIGGTTYANNINGSLLTTTVESTSVSSGSLVVSGGLGVSKTLNTTDLKIFSTIDTTSPSTGAIIVVGGLGVNNISTTNETIENILTVKVQELITSTINTLNTITGALVVSGGMAVAKDIRSGGDLYANNLYGNVNLSLSTNDASSTSTGALVVGGGVGIAKNLYVGGNVNTSATLVANNGSFSSTNLSVSTTSGALVVAGGIGCNGLWSNLGFSVNASDGTDTNNDINYFNSISSSFSIPANQPNNISTSLYIENLISGNPFIANDASASYMKNYIIDVLLSNSASTLKLDCPNLEGVSTAPISSAIIINKSIDTTAVSSPIQSGVYINDLNTDATTTTGIYIDSQLSNKGIYSKGIIEIINTTQSSGVTTGSLYTTGGVGVSKNLNVGGVIDILNTVNSSSTSTGALLISGGLSAQKSIWGSKVQYNEALDDPTVLSEVASNNYNSMAFSDAYTGFSNAKYSDKESHNCIFSGSNTSNLPSFTGHYIENNISNPSANNCNITSVAGLQTNLNITDVYAPTSCSTIEITSPVVSGTIGGTTGIYSGLRIKQGATSGTHQYGSGLFIDDQGSLSTSSIKSAGLIIKGQTSGCSLFTEGTTDTSSISTGSVQINGGAYIAKHLLVGNASNENSTSTSTGTLRIVGGLGISQDIYCGGKLSVLGDSVESSTLKVLSTTASTSATTGSIICSGGIGCVDIFATSITCSSSCKGTFLVASRNNLTSTISSTLEATSATTGALTVTGGLSVGKSLYSGGTVLSTSTSTGSLIVTGGIGCGGMIYSTPQWQDYQCIQNVKSVGSTGPTYIIHPTITTIYGYEYVNGSTKLLFSNCEMPHGFLAGSYLHPHVHFTVSTTTASSVTVNWTLQYDIANIDGAFTGSLTTFNTAQTYASGLTAGVHYLQPLYAGNGIATSGSTNSCMLNCMLKRGIDTYANSLLLMGFDFHYQSSTFGSLTE